MLVSELTALGTGTLMPVVVLGFELTGATVDVADRLRRAGITTASDWLINVDVQAGGYSMSYYSVIGAVFRLADNAEHALGDPDVFLRAFHLMAEDPDVTALKREYPRLVPLCGTWGERYDADKLHRLSAFVRRYFPLPDAIGGLEAFVRLGPAGRGALRGWRYLRVKGGPRVLADLGASDHLSVGAGFDAANRQSVQDLGVALLLEARDPELFLVWENSD